MMCTSLLYAQNDDVSFLVSVYGNMPTSDYGQTLGEYPKVTRRHGFDIGNDVGLAKTGFGLGFEFNTQMLVDGLSWIISARYLTNPTDPSDAEARFKQFLGDTMNVNYETGSWHHFPIMTGLRYTKRITDGIAATAIVQAGINFAKAASRKGTVDGIVGEDTEFQFERDFGYEFGAGLEFFEKWNIEFSYALLNSPRFKGTRMLSEEVFPEIVFNENEILGEERSISMILIRLGYYLK